MITEKVEKDLKKAFIHGRNVSTDLIYQGEEYLPEKEKERR